jgi:Protein of unknown function (DUF3641)
VYNPNGPFLPGNQLNLQTDYKLRLKEDFNIDFNNLFTITNMPIKRFAESLYRKGQLDEYMDLLRKAFNPSTTASLMCKDTCECALFQVSSSLISLLILLIVSVGWDGRVYDCDFNQQLGLQLGGFNNVGHFKTVFDIDSAEDIRNTDIFVGDHCFGCTAGAGSSCQGALN